MASLTVNTIIVAQIQHHHAAASAAMSAAVRHAIEAGGLLAEVKRQMPYGDFGAWVERECGFNYRMGRKYMLAHKRLAHIPESEWPSTANLDKAISVVITKVPKSNDLTNRPVWLPPVGRAVEFADGLGRTWFAWAFHLTAHSGVEAEFMLAMVINLSGDERDPLDFMQKPMRCNCMDPEFGGILTIVLSGYGLSDPASVPWREIDAESVISLHEEMKRLFHEAIEGAELPSARL